MSFQFHNPFPLQSSLKYIWNWFSKSFLEYSASFFNIQEGLSESDKMDNVCYIFFLLCCYEICIDCRCPDQRNYTSLFLSGIEFICFHVCVQTKQCSAQYFWSNLTSYVKNTYKVNTSLTLWTKTPFCRLTSEAIWLADQIVPIIQAYCLSQKRLWNVLPVYNGELKICRLSRQA